MSDEGQNEYPGELATPQQILRLADEYRRAAETLLPTGKPRDPLSRAPYRLSAIHAVELYLNALLLHSGYKAATLRTLQHNLAEPSKLAAKAGLGLRRRTASHLETISETREYLVTRYGPEMTGTASQLNRLSATLAEVGNKVAKRIPTMPTDSGCGAETHYSEGDLHAPRRDTTGN